MRNFVSHKQACQLLHNKFVVVLGSSNQRAIYKDLVLLLQKDKFLTLKQLQTKGEMNFEQDCLVEGGCQSKLHNGISYREVRQFQSDHHLVRFYFLTRIYSQYMESVLEDFRQGLKPDVVVINSCLWDISRYSRNWTGDYKENLHRCFEELKTILPEETLVIWNLTMPLGEKIKGGFLVPEIQHMASQLRFDVIEANFFSGTLADAYNLDVVDLHFHFRFSLHRRTNDGVHWDNVALRRITSVLLRHAADAWGVALTSPPDASEHSVAEIKLSANINKNGAPKYQDRRPARIHYSDHREILFPHSQGYGDVRCHPGPRPHPPMYRRVPLPPPPPSLNYRFPYGNRPARSAPQPYSPMYGRIPLPPPPSSSFRFPYENRPVRDDFASRPHGDLGPYRQSVLRNQCTTRQHYAPYPLGRCNRYNY
ncbi:PC-esterase domain-containing protein 1A-like [Salarias fasciatus]|uniref:PC-esterase domain-containing protein 1A-like n=1 Tax=Salarias fasciatus TaxID=181472 RepID=UPI0011770197|nr:PC-esterase domain-containing protein 1A-like [Salarias fasciatus]